MRFRTGVAAAVLAIMAIGCGSGGDSTEATLTKAQFIKHGDAICREAQEKKTKAINAWRHEGPSTGKGLADLSLNELGQIYLTVMLPPVKEASDELAALTPPGGDPRARKFLGAFAAAVKSVEEKPSQAIKEAPYASADRLAQAYGFEACGLF